MRSRLHLLQRQIIKLHGNDSALAKAVGSDRKGKASVLAYIVAIPLALLGYSWIAGGLLVLVALIWFIPNRRIEQALERQ